MDTVAQAQRALKGLDGMLSDSGLPVPDGAPAAGSARMTAEVGTGRAAARLARRPPREDSIEHHARVHGGEDPRPRRLPPRTGALGRRGFLHPRLRGRAAATARRAASETVAAQGHPGHAAIVQLRGIRQPVRAHLIRNRPSSRGSSRGRGSGRHGRPARSCAATSTSAATRSSCRSISAS